MGNKYIKILNLEFSKQITYRAQVFAGIILNTLYLLVTVYFWKNIFQNNTSTEIYGFTQESIITYSVMIQFLVSTLISDSFLWNIGENVVKGDIVLYVTKPISYFNYNFFKNLGQSIYKLIFKGIPFILIFTYFQLFTITSIDTLPYFTISIITAMILQFLIIFTIGMLSAWFQNPQASNGIYYIFTYGLGGRLIPIDFFPQTLKNIINHLPFQHVLYTPSIIYAKQLTTQAIPLIKTQIIWIIIMALLSTIIFKKAMKTQTVLGG